MTLTRREFGKTLVSSVIGLTGYSMGTGSPLFIIPSAPGSKSRVVIGRSEGLIRVNHDLTLENVTPVLDRCLIKLTGATNASTAWKSLFPGNEKIGIKLSCLPGKPLSSSVGLTMAIVDSLRKNGINDKNIIVWERTNRELERAGFNIGKPGLRIIGTDSWTDQGDGYSNKIEIAGSVGTCFSRIMEEVDVIIDVPVLKDHDLAGVSISMKNFYGAIFNPNKYHLDNCNPYAAELCTHPLIKDKLRLIVCDASRIQVNNGPAYDPHYAWDYGGILVGLDPVALDYIGWQIIETRRKELNLKSLKNSGREPVYINTAAQLKLGNIDEQYIEKIYV